MSPRLNRRLGRLELSDKNFAVIRARIGFAVALARFAAEIYVLWSAACGGEGVSKFREVEALSGFWCRQGAYDVALAKIIERALACAAGNPRACLSRRRRDGDLRASGTA